MKLAKQKYIKNEIFRFCTTIQAELQNDLYTPVIFREK